MYVLYQLTTADEKVLTYSAVWLVSFSSALIDSVFPFPGGPLCNKISSDP
jgi:hypothetical protein